MINVFWLILITIHSKLQFIIHIYNTGSKIIDLTMYLAIIKLQKKVKQEAGRKLSRDPPYLFCEKPCDFDLILTE